MALTLAGATGRPIDTVPARPPMPTLADQNRAELTSTRFEVLNELWDDALAEWMAEHVDQERLAAWGPPDTSVNPLVDLCRQLSTPGLYGRRPTISNRTPADELIAPGGLLDRAGLFVKLQQVQYFTIGLGDFLLRVDALADSQRLAYRLVAPHNVYAVSDDDLPDVPIEIWELRLRWWADRAQWVWTWDQIRLVDKERGGEPSYRSILASSDPDEAGVDVSDVFLGGDFVGDSYPFRDSQGTPLIPYSWYRSQDAGLLWNHNQKRGATRGTFNAALNWTYAQHAARDASGSTIFAVGIEEPSLTTRRNADQDRRALRTLTLTPGAMVFLRASQDAGQAHFFQAGPGANLDSVAGYASLYEQKQAVRWGLNPSDLSRLNANPMSGAALFVSTKGRREYARQLEPLARRADLETIRISAALASRQGLTQAPERGYTITYQEIPESPAEQRERREQLSWELSQGFLSPLEAYQSLHPGASRADAEAAMVEAELDARRINQEVERLAAAEGLPIEPADDD